MTTAGDKPLAPYRTKPHSRRMQAIERFLAERRNSVLLVDEAQKLSANGLELLRDLHDASDPTGRRNLPITLLGDERLGRLIGDARDGRTSRMTSQFSSRLYPILNLADWVGDNGGVYYTVEDVRRITQNQRLKLLTPRGEQWLTALANVDTEDGFLRTAMAVLRGATLFYGAVLREGKRLDVEHLRQAFILSCGKRRAEQIDQATGGELLAKTA